MQFLGVSIYLQGNEWMHYLFILMSNYSLWCDLWTSCVTLSLNSYLLKTQDPICTAAISLSLMQRMMQNPQHTPFCWCYTCSLMIGPMWLSELKQVMEQCISTWKNQIVISPGAQEDVGIQRMSQYWKRVHTRQWGLKVIGVHWIGKFSSFVISFVWL